MKKYGARLLILKSVILLIMTFSCSIIIGQGVYLPESAKPRVINDENLHIYTCGTGVPQVTMQDVRRPSCLAIYANADVLINEAVSVPLFNQSLEIEAKTNPQEIEHAKQIFSYHSNTFELAKLAQQTKVKYLILTHLLPSIGTSEQSKSDFTEGMKKYYSNPITVAMIGMNL